MKNLLITFFEVLLVGCGPHKVWLIKNSLNQKNVAQKLCE